MFPPLLLYLHVASPERRRFGMWLPLFLVWLILLPIVALVLVTAIVVDVVLLAVGAPYHRYTLLLLGCFEVLGAARGTTVSIQTKKQVVDIDLV